MKHYAAAALLFAATGPVMAGGPVAPVVEAPVAVAPAPAPTFDWTGFYAGLSFGQGKASDDGGVTDTDTDPWGLQVGYLRDLGAFVVGGELAYVQGGYDAFPTNDWTSTRLKLIGGYDAGRFLPYGFVGLSNYEIDGISGPVTSLSDTVTIYGLGGRFAVGDRGRIVVGLEYLVENKNNFDGTGDDLESNDLSLRIDYRF